MTQNTGVQVLEAKEFERRFGNLFRSIFCGTAALRASFCDKRWTTVFLPTDLALGQREFEGLMSGAKCAGDPEIVLTDLATLPPHGLASIVPYSLEYFEEARVSGRLGAVPAALFGSSGKWGAISDPEYTIVAGEQEFMDRFVSSAGGRAMLRKQFEEYLVDDAWLSEDQIQTLRADFERS